MAKRRTATKVTLDTQGQEEAVRRVRGILKAARRATGDNKTRLLAEATATLDALKTIGPGPIVAGKIANLETELSIQKAAAKATAKPLRLRAGAREAGNLDVRRVRRLRRLEPLLKTAGVSAGSRVSGIPGVGPTIEAVAGVLPMTRVISAREPGQAGRPGAPTARRSESLRRTIQRAAKRGGIAKGVGAGAVGSLLVSALLSSLFGGEDSQRPQVDPMIQQALLQGLQGGGQAGGLSQTSRTLIDLKRLGGILQMLQSMSQVGGAGAAQPQRLIL